MNRLQATSPCECQARLRAILDEKRQVIEGSAQLHGARETAPAHSIDAAREHFDIGWLCPFCGRNTLRTFYAGALRTLVVDGGGLTRPLVHDAALPPSKPVVDAQGAKPA